MRGRHKRRLNSELTQTGRLQPSGNSGPRTSSGRNGCYWQKRPSLRQRLGRTLPRSRRLRVMMLACCLFWSAPLRGQPCPTQAPKILKAGQTSPCDGVLLRQSDALKLAERSTLLDAERANSEALAARLDAEQKRREADLAKCDANVTACNAETQKLKELLKNPRGYELPLVERPWFVAVLTAVVVTAVAVPVTWLAVTR